MGRVDVNRMLEETAHATGIALDDLKKLFARGKEHTYQPEEWIFHESTPRQWIGNVLSGEVELVRGLHGSTHHMVTLGPGALIGESVVLGDMPHSSSGFTRQGAVIWQLPREVVEEVRRDSPELFYRMMTRIATRMSERLKLASDRLLEAAETEKLVVGVRIEKDSLGERELPNDVYYGIQTQRARENFPISGIPLKNFEHLIEALAFVKKGAAMANHELGTLDEAKAKAICAACDEILTGKLRQHFVVDMFQGGAGTSTNMNANEVIANRALEILGHQRGEYQHLHPNDHVNCSQSTNDVYPTAIKISVELSSRDLLAAMGELKRALSTKAEEFADVLKMGRTENQDAVPMTLGQEFSAYAVMVESARAALKRALEEFHEINMGATAIGTGLNSPPGYAGRVTEKLAEITGLPLRRAENLVEATQNSGSFSQMSGTMKRAAVQISKICNDLRWLSSGPRCGLNEINLPPMQPGSSIMPGKVNPVIPELVNQVCYQIIGYDAIVSMAAEASEMELNMAEPIMAFDLLHGMLILKNACITLTSRCISGITANRDQCRRYVENSIGLVTALNPVLGYERSSSIAKEALKTAGSVYDLVLEKGWITKEDLDDMLRPENMTDPREISE